MNDVRSLGFALEEATKRTIQSNCVGFEYAELDSYLERIGIELARHGCVQTRDIRPLRLTVEVNPINGLITSKGHWG